MRFSSESNLCTSTSVYARVALHISRNAPQGVHTHYICEYVKSRLIHVCQMAIYIARKCKEYCARCDLGSRGAQVETNTYNTSIATCVVDWSFVRVRGAFYVEITVYTYNCKVYIYFWLMYAYICLCDFWRVFESDDQYLICGTHMFN